MTSIFYISRLNFMSTRAHVYTITKTCESINNIEGIKLTLVSTNNALINDINMDKFFEKNNIKNRFDVISLNSISNQLWDSGKMVLKRISIIFSNLSLIVLLIKKRKQIDVIYFRDYFIMPAAFFGKYILGKKLFYESHATIKNKIGQKIVNISTKISDGIIAITDELKKTYSKINKNILVVFCAASEPERFNHNINVDRLRKDLNIPLGKTVIGYIGNMGLTGNYEQYRIDRIIEALIYLPNEYFFVGVGDKNNDSSDLIKKAEELGVLDKVLIFPWQPREVIQNYLMSFDVLVIPYSGADAGDSPTKMFEYLSTEKPIIALETRPVAEVLHNKENAILIQEDKPEVWANAIIRVMTDDSLRKKITSNAFYDTKKYNWSERGVIISNFITQSINK